MGMYDRLKFLQINGLLDHVDVNQEFFYVYKITCTHTGEFYIGYTGDLKNRMYNHVRDIIAVFENPELGLKKNSGVHSKMALEIKSRHTGKIKSEKLIRDSLSVYVMALVADKDAAMLLERHYIKLSSKDKLCLNVLV